jgi:hypothetical protein
MKALRVEFWTIEGLDLKSKQPTMPPWAESRRTDKAIWRSCTLAPVPGNTLVRAILRALSHNSVGKTMPLALLKGLRLRSVLIPHFARARRVQE